MVKTDVSSNQAVIGPNPITVPIKMVQKHMPEIEPFVSKAHSPMHYTAEYLKKEHPGCVTVFIGPCLAKAYEGRIDPDVDYVMNFEELQAFFHAKKISMNTVPKQDWDESVSNAGRGFAISGGVTGALKKFVGGTLQVNEVKIDGLNPENIRVLRSFAKGDCPGNFVEVMSCEGGCVAGPSVIGNPKAAARVVKEFCK